MLYRQPILSIFRSWEHAQTTHEITDHPATRFGSVYFVDIINCPWLDVAGYRLVLTTGKTLHIDGSHLCCNDDICDDDNCSGHVDDDDDDGRAGDNDGDDDVDCGGPGSTFFKHTGMCFKFNLFACLITAFPKKSMMELIINLLWKCLKGLNFWQVIQALRLISKLSSISKTNS